VSSDAAWPLGPLHPAQRRYLAEDLVRLRRSDEGRRATSPHRAAKVDPNPHQIEAVIFALARLREGGCILADEVGLGKTIEAGLVMAQLRAEGARRILLIAPKSLLGQWRQELFQLFDVEAREGSAKPGRLDGDGVFLINREAAGSESGQRALAMAAPFELCVIDEAHEVFAGIYKRYTQAGDYNPDSEHARTAGRVREVLGRTPVLLLTATPIQNNLAELWGLVQYVDPLGTLLGDLPTFRAVFCGADDRQVAPGQEDELRSRLKQVLQRTLRRQAQNFLEKPFVNREARLFEYEMSGEERALYDDVTAYLLEPGLIAFQGRNRQLLLIGFHRRMASSTRALQASLERIAARLQRMLDGVKDEPVEPDDLEEDDELEEGTVQALSPTLSPAGEREIRAEQRRVLGFIERAARMAKDDSKFRALRDALAFVSLRARAGQGSDRVVIFTESLVTQASLRERLISSGVVTDDEVTLLSGQNESPRAKAALQRWKSEVHHEGEAPSTEVAVRLALVHEFKTRSRVFISTEAGAKGLNLQFCNTVVNYDLPWNPQRIEQRIGRCHRYGQQRDVLVLNFLNRQNAADARLYELLERKLHLFDGVFGASDEILGALETGIDFERRVLDIYQSCRSTEEIARAFDALREDLEHRIDARMMQARSLLLERFDGEVRRRLRVAGEEAEAAVDRHRRNARAFARQVLGRDAHGATVSEAAGAVRSTPADGVHWLQLDASALPSRLARLAGGEGWWFVYRFEATGLPPEEQLLHLVLLRDRDGFRPLPPEDGALLVPVPAREGQPRPPGPVSVAPAQERALAAARETFLREVERRTQLELDRLREQAHRYAEDCLLEPREALARAHAAWAEARARLAGLEDGTERARGRAAIERAEREHRRRLAALRAEEETRYGFKDRTLADLATRAKVVDRRALVGTAYFWLA
jgi:hypothetical protein